MTPLYPYMFKAFYEWLVDNDANPRILVDASQPNVTVPREYVTNDKILLSIHPKFISDLNIGPNTISFYTKFKGIRQFLVIPYYAMNELICSDTGLSVPLSMWLTSIEMASHPGSFDDAEAYAATGPMPGERQAEAKPAVSFTEVDSMMPEEEDNTEASVAEDWQRRLRRNPEEKSKTKPGFTIV